jgi:hypothetical protein
MSKDEIKKRIEEIFETAADQAEAIIAVYKLFLPDWDDIVVIHDWPSCGREMWLHICRKFQELDQKKHPDVLPAGIWMNKGFSHKETLADWEVDISTCQIERRPACASEVITALP